MRFCHITTYYPPHHYGGDAILVREISEHLAELGHEVDVVYCRDAFELDSFDNGESARTVPGLNVHGLRHPMGALSPLITHQTGRPGLKKRLLEPILARDYDVVHFHNISLVGGPGILSMSRAPVTLYTAHEHWLFCPTHVLWKNRNRPCDRPQCLRCTIISRKPPQLWRYTGLVKKSLAHVDCLLAPSRFTAEKHREAGITTPIRVFPSFSPLGPAADEPVETPTRSVFVYAGRLEVAKGVEHLVEAFAARPDYTLLLAGSGSIEDELARRFEAFPNIRFLGPLPHRNVRDLLMQATAAVVPSLGPEVFPLSVLEAQSCGLPVIVRRSGGSAEAVEAGGGGWIYDEEKQLLPLLDQVAGDLQTTRNRAGEALENARRNFGIDTWMERYFELIESIQLEKGIAPGHCDEHAR
jgi:glycosyltransferase involved in cell wall biosynthesis